MIAKGTYITKVYEKTFKLRKKKTICNEEYIRITV